MRRVIMICSVVALLAGGWWAFGKDKDTAKAAATRKLLQEKISVDFQDEPIRNVVDELKNKVPMLGLKIDSAGGVSGNIKITYKADEQTLADIFEGMFKKNGLGYVVVSKEGNAYDGTILIKQGKERGYPLGEEPDKTKPDKTTAKGKGKGKEKAEEKTANKGKEKADEKSAAKEKPEDDAQKAEEDAARKLKFAKTLAEDGKTAKAKERLEDIVAKYPKTKAADEARELLKMLDK